MQRMDSRIMMVMGVAVTSGTQWAYSFLKKEEMEISA